MLSKILTNLYDFWAVRFKSSGFLVVDLSLKYVN